MPDISNIEPSIHFDDKGLSWSISPNEKQFIDAAENGDLALLKQMHASIDGEFSKFDPNAAAVSRRSALHHAVRSGCCDTVRFLLDADFNGVKVDVQQADGWGDTVLHMAGETGGVDLARMLVDAGANVNAQNSMGLTCLHVHATLKAPEEVLKFLVGLDETDINIETNLGETALMAAIHGSNIALYRTIMGHRRMRQSIELGIQFKLGKKTESLMDEGDGDTLLMYAVRNGNEEILDDLLLSSGDSCRFEMWKTDGDEQDSDKKIQNYWREKMISEEILNVENKKGITPLMQGCSLGEIAIVQKILLAGELLLRQAGEDADPDDVFDLNLLDKRGNSALHFCSAFGHAHIARCLLLYSNYFGKEGTHSFDSLVEGLTTRSKSSYASDEALMKYLDAHSPVSGSIRQVLYDRIGESLERIDYEATITQEGTAGPPTLVRLNLDEKNKEGLASLLLAAKEGRLDVVETLLVYQDGSLDLKSKDPKGRNARQKSKRRRS